MSDASLVQVEATLEQGASYLTILRDPVEQFVSLWSYSELGKRFGLSLDEFAAQAGQLSWTRQENTDGGA